MSLTPEESARYARHIVLKDIGGPGQQRLKAGRVVIVGAGGLGVPVIAYLAGAGVGALTIVDPDTIALSNLSRQVIYGTADIGRFKAEAAAGFAATLNPGIGVLAKTDSVTPENAQGLLSGADLVIEGTDSFAAKRSIARACAALETPLITGALGTFDGSVTTFAPFLRRDDGGPWPGFDALYPLDPRPEDSPPCELVGVLSVLPGVVGAMMAVEAVKWLTGIGEPLLGRLLIYSARSGETRIMGYR